MKELLNKIHHADCLEFMRQLPDKSMDLVLTDPPYYNIVNNEWDNQWESIKGFQEWCGLIAVELKRVLKDNGSFYWFCDDKMQAYCQVELDKYFKLLNCLVWVKPNAMTIKGARSVYNCYAPVTERILFYEKGGIPTGLEAIKKIIPNPLADYLKSELIRAFGSIATIRKFVVNELEMDSAMVNRWFDGDCLISSERYQFIRKHLGKDYLTKEYEALRLEYEALRRTWNNEVGQTDVITMPINSDYGRFHPTQKPLQLIKKLLLQSSKQGMLVLDCFSGSGTTALASHDLNLDFICIEKDPNYHTSSVKRLEQHKQQLKLI